MRDEVRLPSQGGKQPVWILLLVAASVAFSGVLRCAAPFAAFAAIAACTLPRRQAFGLVGAVWLANQVLGFAFFHYPWTIDCVTWGIALGIVAMLSTLAAQWAIKPFATMGTMAKMSISFLAAFAAYEATLIGFSLWLGGMENYTLAIQGRIFSLNAIALVGLFALQRVGVATGLAPSVRFASPSLDSRATSV